MPRTGRRVLAALVSLALMVSVWTGPAPATAVSGSPFVQVDTVDRVWGETLYDTAAAIARAASPDPATVERILVVSGASGASGDAIAASALAWAYDAPLLMVEPTALPEATRAFIADVTAARFASAVATPTVTVLGGPLAVAGPVVDAITEIVGEEFVEQPWTEGTGYDTAAHIADKAVEVAADRGMTPSGAVFIANGEDPANLYDALSAASVARATGTPILYTKRFELPAPTRAALDALAPSDVIVLGGTMVVSDAVAAEVGATERWAGQTLFDTNVEVVKRATVRGWIDDARLGLAATIPDGVTGSVLLGREGKAVLLTRTLNLERSTGLYLASRMADPPQVVIFGGPSAVSEAQRNTLYGWPTVPVIDAGCLPPTVASPTMRVSGFVEFNARHVTLMVDGWVHSTVPVGSDGRFDFGTIASPDTQSDFTVFAVSMDAKSVPSPTYHVRRTHGFPYPYSTMIVVDKSDFRLYWIRDGLLVKSYKVSVGKPSTPTPAATWKILHKEYMSDLRLGFGPARMRLYRSDGRGGFYRTGYLIHGQSSPWTVGTMESAGCIRMYNDEVLELYPQVPLGTMVITRE